MNEQDVQLIHEHVLWVSDTEVELGNVALSIIYSNIVA